MVTLLFTAIFIVGLLAVTLYFWAPRAKSFEQNLLPPPNPPRGLFSDELSDQNNPEPLLPAASAEALEAERLSLTKRAKEGDKAALKEAHALGDWEFYSEVLDELVAAADRAPALLGLVSYVTRNELPVTSGLAEAVIKSWKNSPERSSTATTLHSTALADDALFASRWLRPRWTSGGRDCCRTFQRRVKDTLRASLGALRKTRAPGPLRLETRLANASRIENAMRINKIVSGSKGRLKQNNGKY